MEGVETMKFANYRPEWLDALKVQEEKIRVEQMNSDEVMRLGSIMVRLAKEKYKKPAALRVITRGQVTFSFLMDGTDRNNEWWMDKKLNTCRMTGVSSIRSLVEVAEGLRPMEPEFEFENNFALCGGCFPLKNAEGKTIGYALCSGLPHECDHQLVADALSELLGVQIPSLLD